jgi:hypothetical protein
MPIADAVDYAEWQVTKATTKGGAWVIAKLIGNDNAAITFNNIANTMNRGDTDTSAEAVAKQFIINHEMRGGWMGVVVNGADLLYESDEFCERGSTNSSILIKLIHNPDN